MINSRTEVLECSTRCPYNLTITTWLKYFGGPSESWVTYLRYKLRPKVRSSVRPFACVGPVEQNLWKEWIRILQNHGWFPVWLYLSSFYTILKVLDLMIVTFSSCVSVPDSTVQNQTSLGQGAPHLPDLSPDRAPRWGLAAVGDGGREDTGGHQSPCPASPCPAGGRCCCCNLWRQRSDGRCPGADSYWGTG